MNRLDEIKAQVADAQESGADAVSANILNEVSDLVAAVEAVLELHHAQCDHAVCVECAFEAPCPTVTAIRTALGEEQ